MSDRSSSPVVLRIEIFKRLSKVAGILRRNKSAFGVYCSPPQPIRAELILVVERARGSDLEQISPLGALQLTIERINFEAKNEQCFKRILADRLFSQRGKNSKAEIDALWERSPEKKVVYEIYALINLSKEVRRSITFRDAFIRVYQNRGQGDRSALNNIAKALVLT